jgi:hypothetical protein
MKRFFVLFILVISFSSVYSQEFDWKGRFGGVDSDTSSSLCIDRSGNLYNTGVFYNEIDLNQDTVLTDLFTSSGLSDFYIQKTDPFGKFIWAKKFGSDSIDRITDIKYFDNKLFVSGQFSKSVNFGSYTLNSKGGLDAFILVLDTSGTVVKASSYGGVQHDNIYSLFVNSTGLYFAGNFSESVFDLTVSKSSVISKLNSSTLEKVWAQKIGALGAISPKSIVLDDNNDVFVVGNFSGEKIDFNPSELKDSLLSSEKKPSTTFYTQDAFILKLTNNGEFSFVKKIGGTTGDEIIYGAYQRKGNLGLVGQFAGSVLFGGTKGKTITSNGKEDIFVALYNINGDLNWVVSAGSTKTDLGKSIFLDSNINVYATGTFFDTDGKGVDFDPSSATFKLTSMTSQNAFIWKLDVGGIYKKAYSFGGSGVDNGLFILANDEQEIFSTGTFEGNATFLDEKLVSAGKSDIYLIKSVLSNAKNYIIDYEMNGKTGDDFPFRLEVYKKDLGNLPWYNNEFINTNAKDTDGEKNSILVDSLQGTGIVYAVKACFDLEQGDKNDWFLPSIEELELMLKNRKQIGGMKDYPYWSSTESNQQSSKYVDFTDGKTNVDLKSAKKYVRPVRKKMKNDGVNSTKLISLDVFPNPSDSKCKITFDSKYLLNGVTFQLIDASGKMLIEELNQTNSFDVDLSGYDSGVYFIRLSNSSMNSISKVIKE